MELWSNLDYPNINGERIRDIGSEIIEKTNKVNREWIPIRDDYLEVRNKIQFFNYWFYRDFLNKKLPIPENKVTEF